VPLHYNYKKKKTFNHKKAKTLKKKKEGERNLPAMQRKGMVEKQDQEEVKFAV